MMRYIAIFIVAALALASCKKGENDPFFSLKTRKGRLAGDWEVSYAQYTINDTTWTYNGSNLVTKVGGVEESSVPVVYEYAFKKSGDYSISRTTNYPENHFEPNTPPITHIYFEEGVWNFTGGAGDTKTKSQLLMQAERIERRIEGFSEVDAEVHDNPIFGKIMDLDMLKNKEMRWKYDYTGNTSSEQTREFGTWEFEKK